MNHSNNFFTYSIVLLLLGAAVLCACSKEDTAEPVEPAVPHRGEILKIEMLASFSLAEIEQTLAGLQIQSPLEPAYPVEVYSVQYHSVNASGEPIVVSGAFSAPKGIQQLPLLNLLHGTKTKRDQVASVSPFNSTEGIIGLITASAGYFTVIPDYAGFGISQVSHPYMHAASLVPQSIDFMRAGKNHCNQEGIALNGQVFLTGYSEGGFVSLATQKTIETAFSGEFNLTAVAPMSGPYDLKGMCDSIFGSAHYADPAYVAYILTAWDQVYEWSLLDQMFNPDYAGTLPALFNGSKDWATVNSMLPGNLAELVDPAFIQDFLDGKETVFLDALQENTLLDWIPVAPLHFFHGDADQLVPIENMFTAVSRLNPQGTADIKTTSIAGATHETAGPAAIFGALQWFENFRPKKQA